MNKNRWENQGCIGIYHCHIWLPNLVGGWATPLKKYESQLGWLFPSEWKIIQMFQTTNQNGISPIKVSKSTFYAVYAAGGLINLSIFDASPSKMVKNSFWRTIKIVLVCRNIVHFPRLTDISTRKTCWRNTWHLRGLQGLVRKSSRGVIDIPCRNLVGGWATPLKKCEFVSWNDYSQLNGKIIQMFQTTNQK